MNFMTIRPLTRWLGIGMALFFSLQLPAARAVASTAGPSLLILKDGLFESVPDVLKENTCTAFLLAPNSGKQSRVLISAFHCLRNLSPNHQFDLLENPQSHFAIPDVGGFFTDSGETSFPVSRVMRQAFFVRRDVMAMRLEPTELNHATPFVLATGLPPIGADVSVIGFPEYVKSIYQCRYEGPTILGGVNLKNRNQVYISNKLKCTGPARANGASGSPVLNSSGQVIGVLSSSMECHNSSSKSLFLYFTNLTQSQSAQFSGNTMTVEDAVDPFSNQRYDEMSVRYDEDSFDIQHITVMAKKRNQRDEIFLSNGKLSYYKTFDLKTGNPVDEPPIFNPGHSCD